MLTFFTCPRGFEGRIGVIQRNAILSWLALKPRPEIILLGNDPGVAEICRELGLRHLPEVLRNELGTPLVNAFFEQVQVMFPDRLLNYINSDILLFDDFTPALNRLPQDKPFVAVGSRWELTVPDGINIQTEARLELLREKALQTGKFLAHTQEYFVFRSGLYFNMLPFAVGRSAYDNWLIYEARRRGVRVINLNPMVVAVHQTHDYSYVSGWNGIFSEGPEAEANRRLIPIAIQDFCIWDSTHILTPAGFQPARGTKYLKRRILACHLFYPAVRPLTWPFVFGFRIWWFAGWVTGVIHRRLKKLLGLVGSQPSSR